MFRVGEAVRASTSDCRNDRGTIPVYPNVRLVYEARPHDSERHATTPVERSPKMSAKGAME